jgi:CheY-like chemotaxis protein
MPSFPGTDSLRILVADDDPVFTTLASSSLAGAGFGSRVVRDGAEALDALQCDDFDIALVDLSMPRVDGFRLIAWVRSTPRLQYLPIIVLSARNDVAAIEEAYGLGANGYQTKPINWALLPTHIRYIAGQARTTYSLDQEVRRLRAAAGLTRHAPLPDLRTDSTH